MDHPLSRRISIALELDTDGPAIECEGRWSSWRQLGMLSRAVADVVTPGAEVGILLRNTPAHVAALLGVLLAGGCVVVVNPSRGDDRTRTDIAALNLPVIVGTAEDIAALVDPSPATRVVTIADLDTAPTVAGVPTPVGSPGVAVRMLTSGTTGPPKRVDLSYDMLAVSVMGADFADSVAPAELSSGVAIVNAPLVHIGGVYRVLQCVAEARPFVLLPRFDLDTWADAVRRHLRISCCHARRRLSQPVDAAHQSLSHARPRPPAVDANFGARRRAALLPRPDDARHGADHLWLGLHHPQ